MRRSPSISPPPPDDQDVYLVLDDFGGRLGRAWRECPEESSDRSSVIADLVDGQFSDPVRVIVFNTSTGLSRDVSREIVNVIVQQRGEVPSFLRNFIERHRNSLQSRFGLPPPSVRI
jgi:hypothetical protein